MIGENNNLRDKIERGLVQQITVRGNGELVSKMIDQIVDVSENAKFKRPTHEILTILILPEVSREERVAIAKVILLNEFDTLEKVA